MQGAYRDDDCKPVVLNVVREAESRVAGSNFMEYLPMGGMKAFTDLSVQLAFGEDAKPIQEGRVAAVQSLSGTGAPQSAEVYKCQGPDECSSLILQLPAYKPGQPLL